MGFIKEFKTFALKGNMMDLLSVLSSAVRSMAS